MLDWSATDYLAFEDERTRPARDLLAAVPLRRARRVVDLGCGPGNSTALLAARFPMAKVTGIDGSPAMLAAARRRLPGCGFEIADAASWSPAAAPDGPPDLVFANALFHWLPDHPAVLARLLSELAEGGVLAVQMPDNMAEPTHTRMREVAESGPWRETLATTVRSREPLPPVAAYYDLLAPLSERVEIWHTVYNHPLREATAIVDWMRSAGLRPFLEPLGEAEQAVFLDDYLRRIAAAYPRRRDGRVLLRFPRLFLVAVRGPSANIPGDAACD
ncbi:MAG TPA: trans-aconitate 2-methyltransferase [Geminicoccaceae bacterium]|nr:trans-aconitate 2-methyltransferase [Geminicoccaceae bacterium]